MRRKPPGTMPSKLPLHRNSIPMGAACRMRSRMLKRWRSSKRSTNGFRREFSEILRAPASSLQQVISPARPPMPRRHKPPLLVTEPMNGGEIQLALQKLNVLGRVLYIAAHPDDENTNLMALWANGSLYETAYLSITRGDGGQNLIGPELRERLGDIRTEELLAARRVDHGKKFFSRAIDFGFSKTAEETMRIWDHDKILSDVVWVVRKFL